MKLYLIGFILCIGWITYHHQFSVSVVNAKGHNCVYNTKASAFDGKQMCQTKDGDWYTEPRQ